MSFTKAGEAFERAQSHAIAAADLAANDLAIGLAELSQSLQTLGAVVDGLRTSVQRLEDSAS